VLVGQFLPSFELRSADGLIVRTNDYLGHQLLLAFVGRRGPGSNRLLRRLQAAQRTLDISRARVVVLTPCVVDVGELVLPDTRVSFPLLRDVNADVHRVYGAVDWSGEPSPSLYIADRWGRVVYRALGGLGETLPSTADIIAVLRYDALAPTWP
jgi:peroxiredoxin